MPTLDSPNSPRRWLRRISRALGWTFLAALSWCVGVGGRIVYTGSHDQAEKADAIIVLGAAVRKGEPSPAFAGRIRHGIELWKRDLAPKLIFTGGLGHDGIIPEAEVARRVAEAGGIPPDAILVETVSTKTWENFTEAARLMKTSGLRSAVIVSDPYHLLRARVMAENAGIDARTSPTPYTAFQTWRSKVPFLINEVRLCTSHWIYRLIGRR